MRTMIANEDNTSDIQTFHFTHLEMALITVAVEMFRSQIVGLHALGHAVGICNKGEATLIGVSTNIVGMVDERMVPERMQALYSDILAGKYS